jgi:hypothetical protein
LTNDKRDERADYTAALIFEYETYATAGLSERAQEVAAVLRALGHEVRPARPAPGQKERAVNTEPVEKAVTDENPKRRTQRAKKAEEATE